MHEKRIKIYIQNELSKFEFKKYTKGYKYLVETIYLSIVDSDAIDNLTKNVFPKVADKYNEKTYLNVKWCIEQVVNTMYNNTKIEILCKYFQIDSGIKPSLKFIVYTIKCNYERMLLDKKGKYKKNNHSTRFDKQN